MFGWSSAIGPHGHTRLDKGRALESTPTEGAAIRARLDHPVIAVADHPIGLHGKMNPDFRKGTGVEDSAAKVLNGV